MSDERGATLLEWSFAEYERPERGMRWYMIAAIIAALVLLYAFRTRNFLFAVIVVMVAVVLYLRQSRTPVAVTCAISDRGLTVDGRFTPYEELHNFWVVDDAGPAGTLFVHHRGIRPRLAIPIRDQDAGKIRATLRKYLTEDTEADEPTADALARLLKL